MKCIGFDWCSTGLNSARLKYFPDDEQTVGQPRSILTESQCFGIGKRMLRNKPFVCLCEAARQIMSLSTSASSTPASSAVHVVSGSAGLSWLLLPRYERNLLAVSGNRPEADRVVRLLCSTADSEFEVKVNTTRKLAAMYLESLTPGQENDIFDSNSLD